MSKKSKKIIILIAVILLTISLFVFILLFNLNTEKSSSGVVKATVINKEQTVEDEKEEGWVSYNINELDGYLEKADSLSDNEEDKSILLLGIDSRDESLIGRSDSILILKFNSKEKTAELVSIPRDSYVYIEGKGYDKINHAYAFGGSDLSKKAVEDLLGLKIDHVASINFKSFERAIDILGGVKVEAPFNFSEKLSNGDIVEFKKGTQLLTGEQALAYARMRKQDAEGDIGRGKRQQEIISSLMNEAKNVGNIFKIKELYNEASRNISTDMDLTDILEILPSIKSFNNIEKLQLNGKPVSINRISYFEIDKESLNEIREKLK